MTTSAFIQTSSFAELKQRIDSRTATVGVVGLGYVGLPLVMLFSGKNFNVVGFDIDERKVNTLLANQSYICRISPDEIAECRQNGFKPTTDFRQISDVDVVVICVPTPLDEFREPDMSYITNTAESIAPYLRPGQLVVLESTTYPGTTTEVLVPILEKKSQGLVASTKGGDNAIYIAFSPEREDPGNDTVDRRDVPKVIGGIDKASTELGCALYGAIFRHTVPVSSPEVAEMTKLLENIYRCVNIALVNELKQLCMRMGIDIWEVIEAAKTKPFGFQPFYPGPGLGGHCIPIDPFYLSWKAREYDFQAKFIELAGEVNTGMPYFVVNHVAAALNNCAKPIKGSKILVLGMSYKKDIDDLRESPSLTIIELLQKSAAEVSYNDPFFPTVGHGRHYNLNMTCAPLDDIEKYDCVIVVTDHSTYNYADIVRRAKLVVDTRNATKGIEAPNLVRC